MQATAPYVRPRPRPREPELEVVEGVRPPALARIVWTVTLPYADIPAYIWSAANESSIADTVAKVQNTYLPRVLQPTTYAKHWKVLLWLEEMQATYVIMLSARPTCFGFPSDRSCHLFLPYSCRKDIRMYDMDNERFENNSNRRYY